MFFLCLSSVCYTCALVTPYSFVNRRSKQSDWLWLRALNMSLNVLTYLLPYWFYQNVCPPFASGGNTSVENNPKHDGDDGTSILGPGGELFLDPLKGNVQRFTVNLRNESPVGSADGRFVFSSWYIWSVCRGELMGLYSTVWWGKTEGLGLFSFHVDILKINFWRGTCGAPSAAQTFRAATSFGFHIVLQNENKMLPAATSGKGKVCRDGSLLGVFFFSFFFY